MYNLTEYILLFIGVVFLSVATGMMAESATYGWGGFGILTIMLGIWIWVRESDI